MEQLPVTIRKSVWGQVGIAMGGSAANILILWALASSSSMFADPLVLFALAVFLVVLTTAFTSVWLRVYSISYVYLDQAGLTAENWSSLFNKQNVKTEWADVEDVSAVTSGFFAQMLGFGTLNVQTAGTLQNLRMVMVPNAEYWAGVINGLQDAATPNE